MVFDPSSKQGQGTVGGESFEAALHHLRNQVWNDARVISFGPHPDYPESIVVYKFSAAPLGLPPAVGGVAIVEKQAEFEAYSDEVSDYEINSFSAQPKSETVSMNAAMAQLKNLLKGRDDVLSFGADPNAPRAIVVFKSTPEPLNLPEKVDNLPVTESVAEFCCFSTADEDYLVRGFDEPHAGANRIGIALQALRHMLKGKAEVMSFGPDPERLDRIVVFKIGDEPLGIPGKVSGIDIIEACASYMAFSSDPAEYELGLAGCP